MILGLFDFTSFLRSRVFSTVILSVHTIMFPSASPEIKPPFYLSQIAPTGLLCSLNIFEHELPFQSVRRPFCIETMY